MKAKTFIIRVLELISIILFLIIFLIVIIKKASNLARLNVYHILGRHSTRKN